MGKQGVTRVVPRRGRIDELPPADSQPFDSARRISAPRRRRPVWQVKEATTVCARSRCPARQIHRGQDVRMKSQVPGPAPVLCAAPSLSVRKPSARRDGICCLSVLGRERAKRRFPQKNGPSTRPKVARARYPRNYHRNQLLRLTASQRGWEIRPDQQHGRRDVAQISLPRPDPYVRLG